MSELSEWANVEEGDTQNTTSQEIIMARLCANYLVSDVLGILQGKEFNSQNFKANPENFAEFINLIYKKKFLPNRENYPRRNGCYWSRS